MALGEIKVLGAGKVDQMVAGLNDYALNRDWENWAHRAEREMQKSWQPRLEKLHSFRNTPITATPDSKHKEYLVRR